MATRSFWSLDLHERVRQPPPNILDQVKHAEKKVFPRSEVLNFDIELKRRNVELIVVLDTSGSSSAPCLAAYAVFAHTPKLVLLHKVCVLEKYRRRGVAKKMLLSEHERLARRGCGKVQLWVDQDRIPARRLYESIGFEAVGRVEDYYGPNPNRDGIEHPGMALLIALLALPCQIVAAPTIGLPINSQAPPVARISRAFNFTFADTTFTSSAGSLDYDMVDAPGWLRLDSSSRTFSGTPAPDNAGSFNFGLVATDDTGLTTMPVTLVVSSSQGPGLGVPVEEQLSPKSGFQAPDTLLLPHSSALSISFSPDTFTDTSHDTVYYALCANNTPLPSWIHFDPGSLSFSGTAPQNTSPDELPQTFDIHFTASNVAGFSAAVASFRVILESHILTFGNHPHIVNITHGMPFSYDGLQTALTLNGDKIDHADVRQIHTDKPDWVSFNEHSWILSGIPPDSADTQNITVTATDVYGESATTTVVLRMAMNESTTLFVGSLGTVNATIGEDFGFTFNKSTVASEAAISVDLGDAASWLKFDEKNLELSGHVPSNLQPQDIILNVTLSQGSRSESEALTINVESATHTSNSRSTDTPDAGVTSSTAPTPTSTPSTLSQDTSQILRKHRTRVAVAIAVPIVVVCLFLILACCFLRRRRRRPEKTWLSASASKRKISRPFFLEKAGDRESIGEMIEKPVVGHVGTPSKAPVIPGFRSSIANRRWSWFRNSRATTDEAVQGPKTDSWLRYIQDLPTSEPRESAQPQFSLVPEEQASSVGERSRFSSRKRPSRNWRPSGVLHASPTKRSRQRQRRSDISFASTGLLSSQRVSGFGHGHSSSGFSNSYFGWDPIRGVGHGNGGLPRSGPVRRSWRNPSNGSWAYTDSTTKTSDLSSNGYNGSERSQTLASTVRALLRPPTSGPLDHQSHPQTILELEDERKASIRAISPETPYTYGSPLDAFHKRRACNRHHRNTFFAAGPSSRASSHLKRIHSVHSPVLSRRQSMSSLPSNENKQRTSHVERVPRESQSSSSSPGTPSRPSPLPRSRPRSRRDLANIISRGITSRFHSSRSSMASNPRFAAAAEGDESRFSSGVGLEEERDVEGNRRWRHVDVPSQGSSPFLMTGGREMEEDRGVGGFGSLSRTTEGMGRQLQRLTHLRQHGAAAGDSAGGRLLVGGSRGKRPVSVDNGLVARGPSMRGDVVDEDDSVFL
ncbi:MAG: hypothetical protein Q9216_001365 [Gyalolechia sp. 2 TL-2023]